MIPGYEQEKYIPPDFVNVTLKVLEGSIAFLPQANNFLSGQSFLLLKGDEYELVSGTLHKVIVTGTQPAFYMYTFTNSSELQSTVIPAAKPKLPIFNELLRRFKNMFVFGNIVFNNIYNVFFQKSCKQ